MRPAILASTLLGIVLAFSPVTNAVDRDQATDRVREPQALQGAPKATAGNPRRRSVRKTTPVSAAPVAVNDTFTLAQDTLLTVPLPGVLTNDTLNSGAIVSYGIAGTEQTAIGGSTPTAHGSMSLDANGAFSYTPALGFFGGDSFRYVLTNSGGSSSAEVALTVTPPPPVLVNDTYTTPLGTQLNVPEPGVLDNDTLHGATIAGYGPVTGSEQTTIGAFAATSAGGTVRVEANGSFRYDGSPSFTGTDTFKYTAMNAGGTATGVVTITVQAGNAIDFTVTSPGFFYVFTGVNGQNPIITLKRGRTYRFRIDTSAAHPFEILNAPGGTISNNNTSSGILIFDVPNSADNYAYRCSIHDFGNVINTVP
jgi:hypothetical protein